MLHPSQTTQNKSVLSGFLVGMDAQCSETYEEIILLFLQILYFGKWSIYVHQILENWYLEIFANLIQKRQLVIPDTHYPVGSGYSIKKRSRPGGEAHGGGRSRPNPHELGGFPTFFLLEF